MTGFHSAGSLKRHIRSRISARTPWLSLLDTCFCFHLSGQCWVLLESGGSGTELREANHAESVIAVVSIFPLLFFTLMSLKGTISDPHWANLAYLGFAILLGNEMLYQLNKNVVYIFLSAGIVLNVLLIGLVLLQTLNPVIDWMPYELKNYQYLRDNGVAETTLTKLKNHDVRVHSSRKIFETFAGSTLSGRISESRGVNPENSNGCIRGIV